VFEEIVRRGIAAGLVEGRHLTVDGTLVQANASPRRRVAPEQLAEVARVSHTVREYLAELEQQNPVADPAARAPADLKAAARTVSASDPDAAGAVKWGRAGFVYFDNYLIDNASRVIVSVEATPARFSQEALVARRMLAQDEPLGLCPESLGADKAYGSGEFLAGLLARGVQPHIPVIDRRHQTGGRFTREQFRYAPEENTYSCPEGQPLRYRRAHPTAHGNIYSASTSQCRGCPQKPRCTPGAFRKLFVHREEPARTTVRALAGTPAYERSRQDRYKVEALGCRTQAAAPAGAGPVATTLERGGAVPLGGHRSESETAGAVHRPRATSANAEHALRWPDAKTTSGHMKPAISRTRVIPAPLTRFRIAHLFQQPQMIVDSG